ncbi:sorting nexin-4-like isoform X3 [Rhipicephalus microplus]|uniref:sorting nexin-4-like isoform X3 n=1 Tax=Rhipicephalus microplus TaxID=6941 RepID=UPI003F6B4A53
MSETAEHENSLQSGICEVSITEVERRCTGTVMPLKDVYIAYQVESVIQEPRKTLYIVWRRYRDFEYLHSHLQGRYHYVVIPPLPEKKVQFRWQNLPTDTLDPEFVERRRAGLEMFLRRVARHPELSASQLFGEFLRREASWRDNHDRDGILHRADSKLHIFNASLRLRNPDKEFEELKRYCTELKANLTNFLRSRAVALCSTGHIAVAGDPASLQVITTPAPDQCAMDATKLLPPDINESILRRQWRTDTVTSTEVPHLDCINTGRNDGSFSGLGCTRKDRMLIPLLFIIQHLADATLDFHASHQQYGQVLSEMSLRDGPGVRGDRLQAAGQFMDRISQAALPFLEEQEEAADCLKEYLAYANALMEVCSHQEVLQYKLEQKKSLYASRKSQQAEIAISGQGFVSRLLHLSSTPGQKTEALEQQLHSLDAEIQAMAREKQEFSEKALAEVAKFREQKERDFTKALTIFANTNIRLCREHCLFYKNYVQ